MLIYDASLRIFELELGHSASLCLPQSNMSTSHAIWNNTIKILEDIWSHGHWFLIKYFEMRCEERHALVKS